LQETAHTAGKRRNIEATECQMTSRMKKNMFRTAFR
jgi:hypothetical protein